MAHSAMLSVYPHALLGVALPGTRAVWGFAGKKEVHESLPLAKLQRLHHSLLVLTSVNTLKAFSEDNVRDVQ